MESVAERCNLRFKKRVVLPVCPLFLQSRIDFLNHFMQFLRIKWLIDYFVEKFIIDSLFQNLTGGECRNKHCLVGGEILFCLIKEFKPVNLRHPEIHKNDVELIP